MNPAANLTPAQLSSLRTEGVTRIFAAIKSAGGEVRFVGGCVRDVLLDRPVGDIDLACNLPPEKTVAALTAAKIKTAPTGIEHGTVTAVVDRKGYEITTLRRDVETYGRKAKVEFTDDWQQDAARRDFTINALYADDAGKLYDYFNGREDLAKGLVRFIGNAEDRIKEDVLRILRFFRFTAWFGQGPADTSAEALAKADADGLKACAALAAELPKLSAERVWKETSKLLAADNPVPVWQLLISHKILPHFLPEATNIGRLEAMLVIEKKFAARSVAVTRLAALLPSDSETAAHVAQKLKLSNRDTEWLNKLATLPSNMRGKLDIMPFRRMLYEYGADICRECALLFAASENRSGDLEPALTEAAMWQKPVLPIQGEDILKLGIKPGPQVGAILKAVEEWWIARDFRPAREECLAEAKNLLATK